MKAKEFLRMNLNYAVIAANRLFNGMSKKVIWVVGDGRSGTTWVSNVINYHHRYRFMFEPFHPKFVGPAKKFKLFHYLRPEQHNNFFHNFAQSVFTGQLQHRRVDRYNRSYFFRGLLIKDIFANLLLKWVDVQFPTVRKVLILRHPCAVAVSKERLKNWTWMTDPRDFLVQGDLSRIS